MTCCWPCYSVLSDSPVVASKRQDVRVDSLRVVDMPRQWLLAKLCSEDLVGAHQLEREDGHPQRQRAAAARRRRFGVRLRFPPAPHTPRDRYAVWTVDASHVPFLAMQAFLFLRPRPGRCEAVRPLRAVGSALVREWSLTHCHWLCLCGAAVGTPPTLSRKKNLQSSSSIQRCLKLHLSVPRLRRCVSCLV